MDTDFKYLIANFRTRPRGNILTVLFTAAAAVSRVATVAAATISGVATAAAAAAAVNISGVTNRGSTMENRIEKKDVNQERCQPDGTQKLMSREVKRQHILGTTYFEMMVTVGGLGKDKTNAGIK